MLIVIFLGLIVGGGGGSESTTDTGELCTSYCVTCISVCEWQSTLVKVCKEGRGECN